jgi:hypothetical protein
MRVIDEPEGSLLQMKVRVNAIRTESDGNTHFYWQCVLAMSLDKYLKNPIGQ